MTDESEWIYMSNELRGRRRFEVEGGEAVFMIDEYTYIIRSGGYVELPPGIDCFRIDNTEARVTQTVAQEPVEGSS